MRNELLNAIGIIPARYSSSRLAGKPLAMINGKTMLQRVWEGASQSRLLRRLIVATDDSRIAEACAKFGAEYIMTPADLPSGTDRIEYAYHQLGEDAEIIVNIQGDEPMITGDVLDTLLDAFSGSEAEVGTLVKEIRTEEELFSPDVVKAVVSMHGYAEYFSRSPVPFIRDIQKEYWHNQGIHRKHIGIYAYKRESLNRFVNLLPSPLEEMERLEQLRLLEDGARFLCVETDAELISVDTTADLEIVRGILHD